jgi:hypothetical protein
MTNYTHQTAPIQFVKAAGIRFAYRRLANRRFGAKMDIPLLSFMHFTGSMDHWDPALTDGFAQDAAYARGERQQRRDRWYGEFFPSSSSTCRMRSSFCTPAGIMVRSTNTQSCC